MEMQGSLMSGQWNLSLLIEFLNFGNEKVFGEVKWTRMYLQASSHLIGGIQKPSQRRMETGEDYL